MKMSKGGSVSVRLQILIILVISGGTRGWEDMNHLMGGLEQSDFEVVITDVESGNETRSPLYLFNDFMIPDSSAEEDEGNVNHDPSVIISKDSADNTYDLRSLQKSPSRLSQGDVKRRVKRSISSGAACDPTNPCAATTPQEVCAKPDGATDSKCYSPCDTTKAECDAGSDEECLPAQDEGGVTKTVCLVRPTTPLSIETPMANYGGRGTTHGAKCRSVPDAIHEVQISGVPPDDKKNILETQAANSENFEYPVCSWQYSRLQCVPDRADENKTTPKPKPGDPVVHPLGTCQCLLGLGEGSVWIPDAIKLKKSGKPVGACYIRANDGTNSKCNYEIAIPSGKIEYADNNGRLIVKNIIGKAGRYCAPGSECRVGYDYVGLRCSCKKHHILDHRKGTCKSDGKDMESNRGISQAKITYKLLAFPLVNAIFAVVALFYTIIANLH